MWSSILRAIGIKPPQPKCWAIFQTISYDYPYEYGQWVKFVGYESPRDPWKPNRTVGPFRSEVDCEEFCRTSNRETTNQDAQRTT